MDRDEQECTRPDEIIETDIVIMNIPFSYPEGDFLRKLFPQLNLAPPYAFNYHRKNNGTFHGLAFANFREAGEAQKVVDALNNYELERRRLRVELKKKLPPEEEERKRLARQLARRIPRTETEGLRAASNENGPPVLGVQDELGVTAPFSMLNLNPAIRPHMLYRHQRSTPPTGTRPPIHSDNVGLDMNDPITLGLYVDLEIFRRTENAEGLDFPQTLPQNAQFILRDLAAHLDLDYSTHGVYPALSVRLTRRQPPGGQHPGPQASGSYERPTSYVGSRTQNTGYSLNHMQRTSYQISSARR